MTYPVRVIYDDCVRNLEIQSKTTSSCRKDEDEQFGISVEILQQNRSIIGLCAPIETEIFISTVQQEVFHDIHNLRHLEKHQDLISAPIERWIYPVTAAFEFRKDTVKKFEFSARSPQEIVA